MGERVSRGEVFDFHESCAGGAEHLNNATPFRVWTKTWLVEPRRMDCSGVTYPEDKALLVIAVCTSQVVAASSAMPTLVFKAYGKVLSDWLQAHFVTPFV